MTDDPRLETPDCATQPSSGALVSVVMATYNRARDLERALTAIADQRTTRPIECIVVDDASTDETSEILHRWTASHVLAVRVERRASNGGPAAARNLGWRLAHGGVVAFTDDDCRPEPGWLDALVEPIAAGAADVTTGRVVPDPDDEIRSLWVHTFSFDGELPAFATCNAAYRRSTLESVGGFDESFRAGEDVDLGHRALATGARHRHVSGAVVRHARTNLGYLAFLRTRVRWGDSVRAFRRHPQLRASLYRGLFLRRHHATTCVDLALIGLSALVSPWGPPIVLVATILIDARRPAPLPGLGNRLRYAGLNWVRQVVDVAVCVRGAVRARVLVL